jgi:hypothetical protein
VADFTLSSEAFEPGAPIPIRHTCDGEDLSPPLSWSGAPEGAASLALVCEDPDAPSGVFVHWVAWGLDPAGGSLSEGESAPVEGGNSFGRVGWAGPCPPSGHGPHRYLFRLHALDAEPELDAGADREGLESAIQGRVLATTELMGTYERS